MQTGFNSRTLYQLGVATVLSMAAGLASAQTSYTDLVVFGDSLSDNGKAYAMTGGAFPPAPYNITFSNGPVAAQYMAANLGLTLTDYAVGGAMTDTRNYAAITTPALAPVLGNTGMLTQVNSWNPASTPTSTSLYMVWGGANDFSYSFDRANAGYTVDFNAAISTAVANVVQDVSLLASKGAHDFFVPGLPDLGLTPRATTNGLPFSTFATALTSAYNTALNQQMTNLESSLGINVYTFDTAGFMRNLITNPPAGADKPVVLLCFRWRRSDFQ